MALSCPPQALDKPSTHATAHGREELQGGSLISWPCLCCLTAARVPPALPILGLCAHPRWYSSPGWGPDSASLFAS